MKKLTLPALAAIAIFVGMMGCKKSSSSSSTLSKTQYLTQKAWKQIKWEESGMDLTSYIQPCEKDNTTTFSTNGTAVEDEGATKCNSTDPQTTNHTWAFQNNESQILWDGEVATINTLDANTLKVTLTTTFNGTTSTEIWTFNH
jgi:hypothetical protein